MKSDKSVSEKMDQLEAKMAWFQGDEFNLDEAAGRYEEIERLVDEVEEMLLSMQNQVDIIQKKFD